MSTQPERNHNSCDFFDEDIVYRLNNKGQIEVGIVVESCENASSSDDDSDTESGEAKKKLKRLKPGTTGVSWYPRGNFENLPEKKVKLYDRSLLPGDVVKYIGPSRNGLIGYCKSSNINFCLKIIGTNKIIENVDSSCFENLTPVQTDIVCIYNSWIGYIDDTSYAVTLLCKDGSIVVLQDEELNDFEDLLEEKSRSCQFSSENNYIGQRLTGPRKCLRTGNWIKQTEEMATALASKKLRKRRVQVTVINVELASISCRWLCCIHRSNDLIPGGINISVKQTRLTVKEEATEDSDSSLKENQWSVDLPNFGRVTIQEYDETSGKTELPCDVIYGDEVKKVRVLNYYQKCTLQVGDLGYYTLKESDKLVNEDVFVKKLTNKIIRERFDLSNVKSSTSISQETDAKRLNQLKESTKNSPSELAPSPNPQIEDNNSNDASEDEYEEVSDSDDDSTSQADSLTRCIIDELTSNSNNNRGRISRKKKCPSVSVKRVKEKKLKPSQKRERAEMPVDLSIGSRIAVQIVSTETKVTLISQNNETLTDVPSYLLYPLHHLDGHEFFPGDFVIENREAVSFLVYGVVQKVDRAARTVLVDWYKTSTTETKPTFLSQENVSAYDIKDHPDHHYRAGCCVIRVDSNNHEYPPGDPFTRAGQVIECCTDGQLLCAWADGTKSKVYPHELFIIGEYDSDDLWASDNEIEEDNLDNSMQSSEQGTPNRSKTIERKGEFAMIESVPLAHSYKDSALASTEFFHRKIRKEITLLKNSLPPDIHVKSFDERIDLFSVMIKGPSDTPYEDGLFLFDIQLPCKYPFVPPSVQYKSYCTDRLNPNLYECGKVCISLLGTWTGKGTEVWDSKSSTLLQLLLSIQGLILVPEPYYNEAGYMRQKGTPIGHENSRLYNEMVIVKLIQSMTKMIISPEDAFKDEIMDHFNKRMKHFISRIENWLKISDTWNSKYSNEPIDKMLTLLNLQDDYSAKRLPGFPLLPGSQGFCLSARKALNILKENLTSLNIKF
ncbi:(E3-independent) E2 ubiquitin-conjugating enzyme-like [Panonychus citri]|uniref:(E3-independent) E2 ubiquitin-conjugating enzyme-like n=1 Tax=Panonychus citri TaxID=50023 RepID=UPI002307E02E|nr:(E3-independent) E2 ubiquitin-conjugating enzyme-like [Panonychus citri]